MRNKQKVNERINATNIIQTVLLSKLRVIRCLIFIVSTMAPCNVQTGSSGSNALGIMEFILKIRRWSGLHSLPMVVVR